MNTLLKPLAIAALLVTTLVPAAAQAPGVIMPGDNGRWHGYMPSGYIGAHPSNRGVHSCTWSASSYCAAWRANGNAKGNGHANANAGGCDSTCQAKCQATWRAGGLPSVRACYAKWSKLNANPDLARACEYKSREEQRRLGWGL